MLLMEKEHIQYLLENRILKRIVLFSIILISIYTLFIIYESLFSGKSIKFADIIYPILIACLFSSYFFLIKWSVKQVYIKNLIFTFFTISVIGSFFQNNGFSGFAVIDMIDLLAVGILIYSQKSRRYIVSGICIMFVCFLFIEFKYPDNIEYHISFNEKFTFSFGIITRIILTINILTVVINAYIEERNEIISKNLIIEKYSKEQAVQFEEIIQLNEELSQANDNLEAINNELQVKNVSLQKTIQELKETQAQLSQSEKMASLGILTAGVAHEINNPLNYIMGGYVGLEKYFTINDVQNEKVKILLSSIKTGIDRASGIVKGLNQFSRNTDDFNEECDLNVILENCLIMLTNLTKDRIEIIRNFPSEPLNIIGNVGKLHQVFINILTNAIQSIKNKGSITISLSQKINFAIIQITDTGCGISEENLSKITDPFFTTKEPGQGTGLGLSISYVIIQEHKGSIEFQSGIGKGTMVTIALPAI
jgi:signal transduction histidine kinase